MTAADYLSQLLALLPRGWAWPKDPDTTQGRTMAGLAEELARVDGRAWALVEEADPRTATELLPDWERVCALPDPCVTGAQSVDARRAAVVARLTTRGRLSPGFFVDLAATLGFEVTVTEFRPFRAGSPAGGALTNTGHAFAAGDACGGPLRREPWVFAWQVNAPSTTAILFRAGFRAGQRLRAWGEAALECSIRRRQPAHTLVIFTYQEVEDA